MILDLAKDAVHSKFVRKQLILCHDTFFFFYIMVSESTIQTDSGDD